MPREIAIPAKLVTKKNVDICKTEVTKENVCAVIFGEVTKVSVVGHLCLISAEQT